MVLGVSFENWLLVNRRILGMPRVILGTSSSSELSNNGFVHFLSRTEAYD